MEVKTYTNKDEQFYPTPKSLLDKITASLKWSKITSVLEPSAGKGDIADYVKDLIRLIPVMTFRLTASKKIQHFEKCWKERNIM